MFALMFSALFFACFGVVAHGVENFMLASGVTAKQEMCVTVVPATDASGGLAFGVTLEECDLAIAAQDRREFWRQMPGGRLESASGQGCLTYQARSNDVSVGNCSSAPQWESSSNGQLRIRGKDLCFSHRGGEVGDENVAQQSAAMATSSALGGAHGPQLSVDGNMRTYWASAFSVQGPVHLDLDFGAARSLKFAAIHWEFPAKSFSLLVRSKQQQHREVFVDDHNFLMVSRTALPRALSFGVRVSMREAAALLQDHQVFGIRNIVLLSQTLTASLDDCNLAAKSQDARDKFVRLPASDADASKNTLRQEMPALQAAIASVAAAASQLATALQKSGGCSKSTKKIAYGGAAAYKSFPVATQEARNLDEQHGVDAQQIASLLRGARTIIIAARAMS